MDIWDQFEDLLRDFGSPDEVIVEAIKVLHQQKYGSLQEITPKSFTLSSKTVYSIPISQTLTNGKLAKISENSKKFEKRTQKELAKVDELIEKVSRLLEEREKPREELIKQPISTPENVQIETTSNESKELIEKTSRTVQQPDSLPVAEITEVVKELKELKDLRELASLKDIREDISSVKRMLRRLESSGLAPSASRRRADLSDLSITVSSIDDTSLAPPERPLLDNVLDDILLFDDSDIEEEETKNEQKDKKKEN